MNLLIDEPPLQVLPSLAKELNSVDKAIILQQIHYWSQRSTNIHDGHKWVYNTVKSWHDQFSWLSEKTVQRYLKQLEDDSYLITSNFNKAKFDRTKWYRINYDKMTSREGLPVPTKGTDGPQPKGLTDLTYTRDYTETTTETTNNSQPPTPLKGGLSLADATKEIISYLNQQAGTSYRASSKATQRFVHARLKENYTVDDCKKVIDIKVASWKDDPKMSKYLRPQTLFSNKFEGYLNEPMPTKQPPKRAKGYLF
ncbi:conserved phage C-terminal domain-containing protein [Limosilactobacillus fermentum]|uniref:conserved phage C-terminal domain-containing protein n=1 Tax=Limosilactobacillus fermentum TaxID=1613 RepID=UPI001C9E77A5|nr:conserved phage C-terminal domain-containing protein [Limosilactobacillus fermentum]